MNPLINSPKNWTEDFSHENGNYMCKCISCKEYFMGHKRRVVCKECSDVSWYDIQGDIDHRQFLDQLQGKRNDR